MKDYARELNRAAQDRQHKRNCKKIHEQMPEEYWDQFATCWDLAFLYGLHSKEYLEARDKCDEIAKKVRAEGFAAPTLC